MRKANRYEYLIWIVYAAMILVCIYLNIFASGGGGLANIIVNVAMFVIVGLVFFLCQKDSLRPITIITADLLRVTGKIRHDAMNEHRFLWEKYREDKDELFETPILLKQFQDYQYELERIVHTDKTYYKCNIDEYINYDLVDAVIHRNRLNQIPGVMTGLGILGTFIGLALGLQSFNTGTSAEIANSIEPLMNGIKVAFHTSIYGMVFSLTFNYVYKRKLDEAEGAVRIFIEAYKKYVLPDTARDGVNRLMELQQQQTVAIRDLANTVAHQLSEGLKELLEPQFDRFDDTIVSFANMATRNQMDSLTLVVNAFLAEMNSSMQNMFTELSGTINQTLLAQRENQRQIETIYEKNIGTAEAVTDIAKETRAVAFALRNFSVEVQEMQKQLRDSLDALRTQTEENKALTESTNQGLQELIVFREALEKSVSLLHKQLREQEDLLNRLEPVLTDLPQNIEETFRIINENLQFIENQFADTIESIQDTVEYMPRAADETYRTIEMGLNRASDAVEDLADSIERLDMGRRK
ncbi:MAG: MotA/TolQ/ExbB proton channel family protein [Lachnospiraceae bacterium]|nr:MotA/TolQ/ExbB proton channel family protein [Lachnospiraceae bacterium]